jgi:hypothetical protein
MGGEDFALPFDSARLSARSHHFDGAYGARANSGNELIS